MVMILTSTKTNKQIMYEVVSVNGYDTPVVVKDKYGVSYKVEYIKGQDAYDKTTHK